MSNPVKFKITGLDELVKRLEKLSEDVRPVVSDAVEDGAKAFQKAVVSQAPDGAGHDFSRHDAFDIQKSKSKTKISWFVAASSKLKSTMTRHNAAGPMILRQIVYWCEFGHVTGKEGDPGLTKKGRKRSKNYLASHGFRTAKNPFVSRAFYMSREKVQAAVIGRLKAWLDKQGK
jgi:HK97 gp10 family phage protein